MLRAMAEQAGIETDKCWEAFSDAIISETGEQSVDEVAAQRATALVLQKTEGRGGGDDGESDGEQDESISN